MVMPAGGQFAQAVQAEHVSALRCRLGGEWLKQTQPNRGVHTSITQKQCQIRVAGRWILNAGELPDLVAAGPTGTNRPQQDLLPPPGGMFNQNVCRDKHGRGQGVAAQDREGDGEIIVPSVVEGDQHAARRKRRSAPQSCPDVMEPHNMVVTSEEAQACREQRR
jgi:hypothetical protein